MALSLIVVGLMLLVSAVQDTQDDLFAVVGADMTGPNSFLQWIVALFLVGAIGFIPKMKGFSIALLALVLLAIFLKNGNGFFAQIQSLVKTGATAGVSKTAAKPQASSYSAA